MQQRSYALGIIAMVTAVIAAFLYLRIMVTMWFQEPDEASAAPGAVRVPWTSTIAISAAVLFTVVVGFFPGWVIDLGGTVTNLAR